MSPDENSQEKETREKENGGVKVWGEDWEYKRLGHLHVATRNVSTLSSRDAHVREFAWSKDPPLLALLRRRRRKTALLDITVPSLKQSMSPRV